MLFPHTLSSMRIKTDSKPEKMSTQSLQTKAIQEIQRRYPNHIVFNSSSDIRCLDFLLPHLLKQNNASKIVKKYSKELKKIYLISMQHLNSLNQPTLKKLSFLVDFKRHYIFRLKEYPENIQKKIENVARYFQKTSLCYGSCLKKIPTDLYASFEYAFHFLHANYTHHEIVNFIPLDKTKEAGFFILFRLQDTNTQLIQSIVYELQTNKTFEWDKRCCNIKDYYNHYQNFLSTSLGKN